MSVVVRVENVSKKYNLGGYNTGSLKGDFNQWWTTKVRKQEDPFAKIGEEVRDGREFWALKDVSFEIRQGEAFGIIGKNGAGKSTLLKILSRITLPTTGSIKVKGRIASLLEVGTGFNPELSGRENIYLNGAILGMTKAEVVRKFDEIVDFSGVEKFIDTPVKRYSSGMYVRLAFAVAAHLDSEILILDEVLAVGDADFQRKCMNKMDEVSHQQGRSIILVSHSMQSIKNLCNRALLLEKGRMTLYDDLEKASNFYLNTDDTQEIAGYVEWLPEKAPQSEDIRFVKAAIVNNANEIAPSVSIEEGFHFSLTYEIIERVSPNLIIGFLLQNAEGFVMCGSNFIPAHDSPIQNSPGIYTIRCEFPAYLLNVGTYHFLFGADIPPEQTEYIRTSYCLDFKMEDRVGHGVSKTILPGLTRPHLRWNVSDFNLSLDPGAVEK